MKKLLLFVALFASAWAENVRADNIINPPGVLQIGAVIPGDCVEWVGNLAVQDAGSICGGSGSGVPGGANGTIQYNNGGNFGGFFMGGDCTLNASTGTIVCTKTAGVSFAPSATTDTTNASNISSGTLPPGRLPAPTATTLGGVESFAIQSHKFLTSISTLGVPANAQPSCADLSNGAASCSTDTTNASNISSGTLNTTLLPLPFTSGTASGSTAEFATASGTLTSGDCVKFDVSGNVIDAGAPCGTGSGVNNSGTAGNLAYYALSGTTISGNTNANMSSGALTLGIATSSQGSLKLAGSTSGTTTLAAPTSGGGTLTLPAATDTLADLAGAQTLSNKTLITPIISSISNTGTLTLPTSNDTLTGRATTDTLTNKSISGSTNTLTNIATGSLATVQGNGTKVQLSTGSTVSSDCVKFDANGNTIDAGFACGQQVNPGGSNTNIQFNDSGVFGGSANFTFNKTSKLMQLTSGYESLTSDGTHTTLEIQPSAGIDSFGAYDTTGATGLFNIDSAGHIYTKAKSGANLPTISFPNGQGSGSISGTDVNGIITVNTSYPGCAGGIAGGAEWVTVTFGTAYATAPKTVMLTLGVVQSPTTSFGSYLYVNTTSTTSFSIDCANGTTSGIFTIFYLVVG